MRSPVSPAAVAETLQSPPFAPQTLHGLLRSAESAAMAADAGRMTELGQRIAQMFAAASLKVDGVAPLESLDESQLVNLRAHLERYRDLCAALSQTLRSTLQQATQSPFSRYAPDGDPQVERRPRFIIEGYG
jgi:hypothetical protein